MAFDARIASRISSDSDKLYYLDQQLEGEAKELIGGCLYMNTDVGYIEARNVLHKQYGDPYKIYSAYIRKIIQWPLVRHDDSTGLRRLCFFLIKCNNAMSTMSDMSVLNHAPNMQSIIQKLPNYMQNKWCNLTAHLRKCQHRTATFSDLVSFIDDETNAANDPIYGREALSQYGHSSSSPKDNRHVTRQRSTSFATNVNGSTNKKRDFHLRSGMDSIRRTNDSTQRHNVSLKKCPCCNQNHDLDDCEDFSGKTMDTKR